MNKLSTRDTNDFVLEKSIFSNIFEKDIRRIYIYKKAERLAKAIHLITPAFSFSPALKNKIDSIAVGLIEAAILPPISAREALSRELLALSSVLSIGRSGGALSSMNADLIAREARLLLQETASYEEPRVFLDEAPTLAGIAKGAARMPAERASAPRPHQVKSSKGHLSDIPKKNDRREAILSVIRDKGRVYIKDVSGVVRGVSEKTIQRELQALVKEGMLVREGERRWTLYSLA